ncbi:MAG: beta-ketoacyl-[acyl-carrier-protein] synthase family protein [Endomicrobiales bacterium]
MNKAVVTGMGLVTPLGLGREKTWQALLNGESGVAPDAANAGVLAARVKTIDVPAPARLLSLAFLAAAEAFQDSGLGGAAADRERWGCTVSVSKPNLSSSLTGKAVFSEAFLPFTTGRQLSGIFNLKGPARNITAACATGADSVIIGAQWIEQGLCDVVLAGAVESSMNPLYQAGFRQMGVLASGTVRPFDRRREGFAMGEGAAIFVLERKDHAVLRGASLYGEITGSAMASDTRGIVAFDPSGGSIAAAIQKALARMGRRVDYIHAHGTATRLNDAVETRAIKKVFGAAARDIAVSSTKAATGHLLGASGAAGFAFCLLALRDGIVPPTLNLDEPDAECDLDYTPHRPRFRKMESALSLSFGFGGQIGVVGVCKG